MVDKTDDKTLTAEGEDEEFVIVEVADEAARVEAIAKAAAPAPAPLLDKEDDDEEEPAVDSRLADDDEGDDTPAAKERKKRRERQKAARDAAQARIRNLETTNSDLLKRLEALEGGQTNTQKAMTARAIEEAKAEAARAERVIAAAVEAGNGEDMLEATRLRDAALERKKTLEEFDKTLVAPTPRASGPNPAAAAFQSKWIEANPWFKPDGSDDDSAMALAIDRRITAEGYDPGSIEYWQELTRRVSRLFPQEQRQQR